MSEAILAALNPALIELLARENDPTKLLNVAKSLRSVRRFRQLALFSERVIRRKPLAAAPAMWQLHAQALVELGLLTTAASFLDSVVPNVAALDAKFDQAAIDLLALRGRVAKQRYVDLSLEARSNSTNLLKASIHWYQEAFARAGEDPSRRYYPGINLVALARLAENDGLPIDPGEGSRDTALKVKADLEAARGSDEQHHWWQQTMAECCLALGDDAGFSEAVKKLVEATKSAVDQENELQKLNAEIEPLVGGVSSVDVHCADAFALASFNRQLDEIWTVQHSQSNLVLQVVAGLKQALLERDGGAVPVDDATVKTLQSVWGEDPPLPYRWVKRGVEAAQSVAAVIMDVHGRPKRIGTAFRIAMAGGKSNLVLTNAHVVSDRERISPERPVASMAKDIRLRFEALDEKAECPVKSIVWTSSIDGFDATLLEIGVCPELAKPLTLSRNLPHPGSARVYVIGHAYGDDLALSLQDNELLDQEAIKEPAPPKDRPVRLHYRTPTERGSSGSPVFENVNWSVIALHHASVSDEVSLLTLSGRKRYARANEGISMDSIARQINRDKPDIDLAFID